MLMLCKNLKNQNEKETRTHYIIIFLHFELKIFKNYRMDFGFFKFYIDFEIH